MQNLEHKIKCYLKCYYSALSVTMNCTVQNKQLVCEGLPFCANNVYNYGVVLICVQSTSILEELYFCFQQLVYSY